MWTRSAAIEAAALGGVLLLSLLPALTSQVDDVDVLIYAAAAARAMKWRARSSTSRPRSRSGGTDSVTTASRW